jgi:hypothetical protein
MNAVQIRGDAMFMAASIELFLAFVSVLMVFNWRRAARGTLDRNAYVGIRLPRPMRSRAAWVAAHRVAYRWAPLYVLFNLAMGAGLFAAASRGWRLAVAFIGGAGLFVLIVLMCGTALFANRAANAVDAQTDHHRQPRAAGDVVDRVRPQRRISDRHLTILRWVFAAAACAANAVLLGSLIDGYVLALHHQLQPGDNFGIRDDTALACWPRWYAAQIALFSWMLFGYGLVLVGAMGLYVGAAIQRRRPWDIWALVLGTVFVMLPFLIASGIHADSVARAITCPSRPG